VLAQTSWVWLVVYLLADHCGLILYKLARGDLVYWIPRAGVPLSMLARFMVKVIVDFTGYARSQPALGFCPHLGRSESCYPVCGRCVQTRHPLDLGGIYFFVNALKSVASWFVAAALYSRYFVAETTELGFVAGMNTAATNYSGFLNSTGANVTGANVEGAVSAFVPAFKGI
jgi:hypothetical protein